MKNMGRKWIAAVVFMVAAGLACAAGSPSGTSAGKTKKAKTTKTTKIKTTETKTTEPMFAIVDGTAITGADFDVQFNLAIRNKFYHRRPPEEELGGLRREVGDHMIERILLVAEAKRRGLQADPEKLRQSVAQFEERNSTNPRWQKEREQLLPALERELGDDDLLAQIEKIARQTPGPQPEQLRQVYDDHRDKFTEPEQVRLSIILLKMDPGLPKVEKEKILEQAKALHTRLVEGEDFAALAKEYSGDETAAKGGDMGYIHRGMMGNMVYKEIEGLAPGAFTEPLMLMEGVAILRFDGRIEPQLKSLEESKERAVALWQKETAERQWRELKDSLRKAATVKIIDTTRYPKAGAPKPQDGASTDKGNR